LIDPVDGTANFLSGVPFWAVSIAYVRDNEPVLGAIALPALDALFWTSVDGPLHGSGSVSPLVGTQPIACEVCGVEAVDAHHDQYDEPLRVRWLCRRHHTRLHHYGEDMFPIRD